MRVNEIWVTFPDPHPGGRNANKRLTSPRFLNSYRSFLQNDGIVHLKTDNSELYQYTKAVVSYNNLFTINNTNDLYSGELSEIESISEDILSIKTHYEKIFLNKGLKINYISFRLEKEKIIADVTSKIKRE